MRRANPNTPVRRLENYLQEQRRLRSELQPARPVDSVIENRNGLIRELELRYLQDTSIPASTGVHLYNEHLRYYDRNNGFYEESGYIIETPTESIQQSGRSSLARDIGRLQDSMDPIPEGSFPIDGDTFTTTINSYPVPDDTEILGDDLNIWATEYAIDFGTRIDEDRYSEKDSMIEMYRYFEGLRHNPADFNTHKKKLNKDCKYYNTWGFKLMTHFNGPAT